jgi:hypothetical protein
MRLLNTTTLEVESFADNAVPSYAILSHVWGPATDEVSFEDMRNGAGKLKPGYVKLQKSSLIATNDGYKHIWIDTCCIDKSSSAELSEAINSMFRYYQNSEICYAYLADVSAATQDGGFARSKWFTRGWTLQELIAPRDLQFLSRFWTKIGMRAELACEISQVTNVSAIVLEDRTQLQKASVAKRMSWASQRTTTREEDIAYSLMGIFDVNMPLLYGEGGKAFSRLQEEIMKSSTDQSLFAWTSHQSSNQNESTSHDDSGLLARHPKAFSHSSNIVPYQSKIAFSMTNKGLHITLPIVRVVDDWHVVILACHREGDFHGPIGIRVIPAPGDEEKQSFLREFDSQEGSLVDFGNMSRHPKVRWQDARPRSIYILKGRLQDIQTQSYAWIRKFPADLELQRLVAGPQGNGSWDQNTNTLTWAGVFRSLDESQKLALLGSIIIAPTKYQLNSNVVVHFGIHRQGATHLYTVQPCLCIRYAPMQNLFNLSSPRQLSKRLRNDWSMISWNIAVCASVKSARVMDKQISIIDIWTADLNDNITFLFVSIIMVQMKQFVTRFGTQLPLPDYVCGFLRACLDKALLIFEMSRIQLPWPNLIIMMIMIFMQAICFMLVVKDLMLDVVDVKATGAFMEWAPRRSVWHWLRSKSSSILKSLVWSVLFSKRSTSLRKVFTIQGCIRVSLSLALLSSTLELDYFNFSVQKSKSLELGFAAFIALQLRLYHVRHLQKLGYSF